MGTTGRDDDQRDLQRGAIQQIAVRRFLMFVQSFTVVTDDHNAGVVSQFSSRRNFVITAICRSTNPISPS